MPVLPASGRGASGADDERGDDGGKTFRHAAVGEESHAKIASLRERGQRPWPPAHGESEETVPVGGTENPAP
jgi:hypothetical protein